MEINKDAQALNDQIKKVSETVYDLLSEKGKAIFFPHKGILGQTAQAKGKDINATIGIAIEDDGSPMRLNSIESQFTVSPKDALPYAPSFGKPELRAAWKKLMKKKNPSMEGQLSNPVVTSALTHGLSMVGYMFLNPGDSIIMPDFFWGNYKLLFINAYDAKIDTFKTFDKGLFNVEGLKEKLDAPGDRKILLLNFPNNPTGYTPTEEEAAQIVDVIKEAAMNKKMLVICDDAYFGLVYEDEVMQESIFARLNNLHENILAVKIDGATKEDYAWGLRTGFITYGIKNGTQDLYTALEDKTAGAVRGSISNAPHLSQSIVLQAIQSDSYEEEKQEKYNLMKSRYEAVKNALDDDDCAGHFDPLPFNSGYFMCIKLAGCKPEKIRELLLEKYSTGTIAASGVLRIAFSAVPASKIKKLFDNICDACKQLEE